MLAVLAVVAHALQAPASDAPAPVPSATSSVADPADHQLTNQEIAERNRTALGAPGTNEPAAPTDEPTLRPPDRHAQREVAHTWWNKIIVEAAIADGARQGAVDAIASGDLVAASALVKKAHQYSLDASNRVSDGVPDGWDDVAEHLSNAMAGFAAMYEKMERAIDDAKPSTMASAVDDNDNANAELQQAVHLARVHYVAMGGKWSDITDGSSEAKAMGNLVHALDSGDQ